MKLSHERIEQLKKFCATHPKVDAVKVFGISRATVENHTKGINWKKKKQ